MCVQHDDPLDELSYRIIAPHMYVNCRKDADAITTAIMMHAAAIRMAYLATCLFLESPLIPSYWWLLAAQYCVSALMELFLTCQGSTNRLNSNDGCVGTQHVPPC